MTTNASYAVHSTTETIHAQPYSGAYGFYFSSLTDYLQRAALLAGRGVEEWELSYCEGEHAELFEAAGISQASIETWYEMMETLDEWQEPALFCLLDTHGYDLAEALPLVEDVMMFEGTPEEWAIDLMDSTGELESLPETLRYYFSYSDLAKDCLLNGEIHEVSYRGTDYVMSGV